MLTCHFSSYPIPVGVPVCSYSFPPRTKKVNKEQELVTGYLRNASFSKEKKKTETELQERKRFMQWVKTNKCMKILSDAPHIQSTNGYRGYTW